MHSKRYFAKAHLFREKLYFFEKTLFPLCPVPIIPQNLAANLSR
jgi:hypothetical protein